MSYSALISGAGKWAPISVTEMLSGQPPTEKTGFKFIERVSAWTTTAPPSLGYDLDGNQTIDPRWDHTWDAENRLIKSQLRQHVIDFNPTMPNECITYTYDAQWRRATKKVETRASATAPWMIQTHMRYAYEGWNLIAEWEIKTSPAKLTRTHHWGIDLSGTRSGAGGVGGLVMTRHHALLSTLNPQLSTKSTIPAYDGTGNILAYVDTADGTTVATYEYGPFGEPLRETGPLAKAHPHRWSSKYTDEETGFSYYGYRYYVPSAGRWLSRDPIDERGGVGLYAFVYNDAIGWMDVLGLYPVSGSLNPGTAAVLAELAKAGMLGAGRSRIGPMPPIVIVPPSSPQPPEPEPPSPDKPPKTKPKKSDPSPPDPPEPPPTKPYCPDPCENIGGKNPAKNLPNDVQTLLRNALGGHDPRVNSFDDLAQLRPDIFGVPGSNLRTALANYFDLLAFCLTRDKPQSPQNIDLNKERAKWFRGTRDTPPGHGTDYQ